MRRRDTSTTRRRVIPTGTASVFAGLAGCGNSEAGSESEDSEPTPGNGESGGTPDNDGESYNAGNGEETDAEVGADNGSNNTQGSETLGWDEFVESKFIDDEEAEGNGLEDVPEGLDSLRILNPNRIGHALNHLPDNHRKELKEDLRNRFPVDHELVEIAYDRYYTNTQTGEWAEDVEPLEYLEQEDFEEIEGYGGYRWFSKGKWIMGVDSNGYVAVDNSNNRWLEDERELLKFKTDTEKGEEPSYIENHPKEIGKVKDIIKELPDHIEGDPDLFVVNANPDGGVPAHGHERKEDGYDLYVRGFGYGDPENNPDHITGLLYKGEVTWSKDEKLNPGILP